MGVAAVDWVGPLVFHMETLKYRSSGIFFAFRPDIKQNNHNPKVGFLKDGFPSD